MITEISLDNGKYKLQLNDAGGMKCLRYDNPWRDLTGDGLIYYLSAYLLDQKAALQKARDALASYHIDWAKMNRESPDYDKDYQPTFPKEVTDLDEVLASFTTKTL